MTTTSTTTVSRVRNYEGSNQFLLNLKSSLQKWGSLTPKQMEFAEKALKSVQTVNVETMSEDLQKIADKIWVSVSVLSIAWVSSRTFVHSNIIWATTMKQLKENISSVDVTLSEETITQIDELFTQNPNPATF